MVLIKARSSDLARLDPQTESFGLGEAGRVERLQSGLLQQTWRLDTDRGQFVCQRLHAIFDARVTADAQAVSEYLRSAGIPTPCYLTTQRGDLHLEWEDGLWRVMGCLAGTTHRSAPHLGYLHQAGFLAGKLHLALRGFQHRFQFCIPHFHDTTHIYRHLFEQQIPVDIESEAQFFWDKVPDILLPEALSQQIIHGDLKLANFLFDEAGSVVGLLDLDTFMYHNVYIDLGDALRSWCSSESEFSWQALEASLRGYGEAGALALLDPEHLLRGLQQIILELGMRFAIDYLEDRYFSWDPSRYPNRKAHNLDRTRRQIAVYQDLLRQETDLRQRIRSLSQPGR